MSAPLPQLTCPSRSFLSDSPLRLPGLPKPIKSTSHSRLRLLYVRPRCAVPPLQLQLLPLLLLPVADAPTLTPIYAILPHRSLLAPLLHHTTVPLSPRTPPPSPTTHTNHALRAWGFKLQTSEPPKLSPPLMLFNQVRRVRKQSPGFVRTTYLLHQKTTTTTRHTPPPPPPLPSSSSSFSAFPLPARSSSSYLPNAIGVVYA